VDGPGFPNYRYGGMWKNKHAGASAKIKGKAKAVNREGERKDTVKVKGEGRREESQIEMGAKVSEDEPFRSCEEDGEG
jgi:hypothetical protein